MADRDDTYYPDNSDTEEVPHVQENPWRPAPRHAASGRRHIANLKAMLKPSLDDGAADRAADQWAAAGL